MSDTSSAGATPISNDMGVVWKNRLIRCYVAYCTAWENEIYFEGIFQSYTAALEYCSNNFVKKYPLDLNVHRQDLVVFWVHSSEHDYDGPPEHKTFMETMKSKGNTLTHNIITIPFTKPKPTTQNDTTHRETE